LKVDDFSEILLETNVRKKNSEKCQAINAATCILSFRLENNFKLER
jgi:hypothetical protein